MTTIQIATVSGLIALISWGASDWLTGKTSKKLGSFETDFVISLPGVLMMAVILAFAGIHVPNLEVLLKITLVAALFTAAYLLFIKALSTGFVGIVVPLSSIYPLITLTLSLIFLNVVFVSSQFIAMLGIAAGAVFLAYEKNHNKIPIKVLHQETALALGASLAWGLAFFVVNDIVQKVSWQTLLGLLYFIGFAVTCTYLAIVHRSKTVEIMKKSLRNRVGVLSGVIAMIGNIAFYTGSEAAKSVIIITIIASGAPLVSSLLGAVFDKEKIGILRRVGAVMVVTGIVILNIS